MRWEADARHFPACLWRGVVSNAPGLDGDLSRLVRVALGGVHALEHEAAAPARPASGHFVPRTSWMNTSEARPPAARGSVLVIEDDADSAEVTCAMLRWSSRPAASSAPLPDDTRELSTSH